MCLKSKKDNPVSILVVRFVSGLKFYTNDKGFGAFLWGNQLWYSGVDK